MGSLALRLAAAFVLLALVSGCSEQPAVQLQRVPDQGIHPRILVDGQGQTHLLYFRRDSQEGRSAQGLLYYRQYDAEAEDWGPAVRVSTDRYDHGDPIFRAGFASDDEGRIHVVWHQSRPAEYFYTRSNTERSSFEPQRRIVADYLDGIDAGAAIAVRGDSVAVVWAAGDLDMEASRSVYLRLSTDAGTSFAAERMIGDPALGACACCGLAAEFDQQGRLLVAYRSAIDGTGRNMQILSVDPEESGAGSYLPMEALRSWDLAACPVTTNDFVPDAAGNPWLVFENQSRVVAMTPTRAGSEQLVSDSPPQTREKHPAAAINDQGEHLVAWGEGAGFFSGGSLHWALFDSGGARLAGPVTEPVDIPDNSSPAVMVDGSGDFIILY
ncbi:MAG: hypothetical protein RLZZ385_1861 [Pseudomonadota bacterium]|jgi:hypothetical protein